MNEQLIHQKANLTELVNVNNELMQVNMLQEQHIGKLKDKSIGGDIAHKYDMNNYKNAHQDPRVYDNSGGGNNWDQENVGYQKNPRFDEFAKENQLWLGNTNNNLEKVKYDNTMSNPMRGNAGNKGDVHINTKKYSPMNLNK
mmetsp:Transcript_35332/g.36719  ORF Transcript_35332/g.36719 Transcript_35332/m.36719 type:complete len:142 (+) Transcript_35332:3-428(+)